MIVPEGSVTYTTYALFCRDVIRIAFPQRVGHTQKPMFDNAMAAALIKAQRFIDCLRKNQVNFYYHEQLTVQCGVAQFRGPRGKINAVYSFKPGEQCAKHFYIPSTPQRITCWSQESACNWTTPDTTVSQSAVDLCYPYTSTDTEEADDCWKCADKFYARDSDFGFYLAPRPPCGYITAVHWEGLRRSWGPTDTLPDDQDLKDWVAEYVQKEMTLRVERDRAHAGALNENAREKFADLIYWCTQERRLQFELDCANGLDTGNLSQILTPIYPYPYQEV